jgi:octaprenyl-diphosphate synthase
MAKVVSLEGKRKAPGLEPLLALCADDMARVDREIIHRMRSPVTLIPELANHLVGAGGKRMRPLLTVAAARLCGYAADDDRHIKLATCVEFIHSATLLHDDVVDVSALRRGRPTANSVWGDKASVLVGDFLFTRSFELMVDVGALERGGQRIVALDQGLRLQQVAVALVELLDGALPEFAVDRAAAQEGEDHRQGDLALSEVVADGLA